MSVAPFRAALAVAVLIGCLSCSSPAGDASAPVGKTAGDPRAAASSANWFVEQAEASGIDFVHFNGASGRYYYPEILAPGVALFDYDNDGDLDAYLVQGAPLGGQAPSAARVPPYRNQLLRGRLYRNDLAMTGGTRVLRFTDVTDESRIDARGYGLGVATADIDNDGWTDLYLTNFGPSQMWRNNGDGTFADVTAASGTANQPGFGVSASFFDYDRDGWLDLYVGNNVNYRLDNEKACPNPAGVRDYCPPQIYGGQPDRLFRNTGRGRFVDVTSRALKGGTFGPALGVIAADFDDDGWVDVYVANDGEENLLWINQKDGTFRESALLAGAAITAEGRAESSMGLDAGDYDNDGDDDVIITELTGEGSNLFLNEGGSRFRDVSAQSGLGSATLPYTGWGTSWIDYDNDGWLDALAVNGTIIAVEGRGDEPFPYDQRKVLLRNRGNGRLELVSQQAGPAFELSEAGRGAAFGDVDNDGDVDVLIGNNGGRTRLLVNQIGTRQHWLGVRVVSGDPPRNVLGARVGVTRADGTTMWRRARADGSYASANDPRALIGLGPHTDPVTVNVRWPDGRRESWSGIAVDRWITLKAGTGQ
jgi:hypothetical protein